LVDASHVSWATSRLGTTALLRSNGDGAAVFELHVRQIDALRTFALGFLQHAEVLTPESMRQDMIDWLQPVASRGVA